MRISELIKTLEDYRAELGDMPVITHNGYGDFATLTGVEAVTVKLEAGAAEGALRFVKFLPPKSAYPDEAPTHLSIELETDQKGNRMKTHRQSTVVMLAGVRRLTIVQLVTSEFGVQTAVGRDLRTARKVRIPASIVEASGITAKDVGRRVLRGVVRINPNGGHDELCSLVSV